MLVKRTCQQCGESFNVRSSQIKKGTGKYCSRICANLSRMNKITMFYWVKAYYHNNHKLHVDKIGYTNLTTKRRYEKLHKDLYYEEEFSIKDTKQIIISLEQILLWVLDEYKTPSELFKISCKGSTETLTIPKDILVSSIDFVYKGLKDGSIPLLVEKEIFLVERHGKLIK